MTYKQTVKTLLFASVIAAMILPFSAMDFAQAVNENANERAHENADVRVAKLAQLKAEIQRDKDAFTNEQHYEADLAIKRIELAEKLVKLENAGNGNSQAAYNVMKDLQDTQSGITYPNVERNENHQIGQLHKVSWSFDEYDTNSVTRADCANQGTDYGSASGTITGYTSSAYLVGTLSYPSQISDGTVGNCTNTSWSDHDMTYVLLTNPFVGCAQPSFTSSTDEEGGTCYNLSMGDVVVVTVSKQKYGSTNFSWLNPATIVTL